MHLAARIARLAFPVCPVPRTVLCQPRICIAVSLGRVRGLLSGKVPNSSFAEVRMGLLIEPTHMEDEDEDQENEKENERDGEECRVEGRRVSR